MKDLLLNEDGDLHFKGSDVVIGEATAQTVQTILTAHAGEFKETPTLGVGVVKKLKSPNDPFFTGTVKQNLKIGNIDAKKVELDTSTGNLTIEL